MAWLQRQIEITAKGRGWRLITPEVLVAAPEVQKFQIGLLHVFLRHTSASLAISENADSDVPLDLEVALNRLAPEAEPYRHSLEGRDDMPAHVKNVLLGSSLSIPIQSGRLLLGTWQGIYLCEHRNRATPRQIVLTVWGEQ